MPQVLSRGQLSVEEDMSGVTIVNCTRKEILDEQDIQQFGEELEDVAKWSRKILLNLRNVERLCSSALCKLVATNKRVRAAQGKLRLCCLRPNLRELFRFTRLDMMFDIYKDELTGLDGF